MWQLEGKDFFTKELDESLLNKEIDMVVHSYKDLGSERPSDIELACITERKYAHDVLLIKTAKIKELTQKPNLIVGTSSPRRIFNLQNNLARYLPNNQIKVECKILRGNVNTRIEKLLNDEYDAIVLAMAGLERLASSPESRETLQKLTKSLNFMILPQKDFPSSASQGALAIETNKDASLELKEALKTVHHQKTAQEVSKEREAFNSYGGGCHLPVGIHVKKVHDFFIHFHQGENNGKRFKRQILEGYSYPQLKGRKPYYVFSKYDFLTKKLPTECQELQSPNLFMTSTICLHNVKTYNTLWTAGNRSMKKLITLGHWVNGSAEGFGHDEIENFKNSNFVQLFSNDFEWIVLSHDKATSELGDVVASYTHEIKKSFEKKYKDEMMAADIIYWSSIIQYNFYTDQYPELTQKQHACGLGKTYKQFMGKGIEVIPCIDMNHLENLVRTENE